MAPRKPKASQQAQPETDAADTPVTKIEDSTTPTSIGEPSKGVRPKSKVERPDGTTFESF
jgi:hypothetical protein